MAAPKTPQGRERSKYNSLKGGLYSNHLLTCTESCIYIEICPVYDFLVNQSTGKTYTCSCIVETLEYMNLKQSLQLLYNNLSEELTDEYIRLCIRVNRLRRFISLNPDMNRDGRISEAYILLHRFQRKLLRLTEEILRMDAPYPIPDDLTE